MSVKLYNNGHFEMFVNRLMRFDYVGKIWNQLENVVKFYMHKLKIMPLNVDI